MSDLETIIERDILITSTMMTHESGTKFYQVLTLSGRPSDSFTALCVTRYGRVSARESGGVLGKGKLIQAHVRNKSAYGEAIVRNKEKGGYSIDSNPFIYNWPIKLREYDIINTNNDDAATAQFFAQFGIMAHAMLPISIPVPVPEIVRSAEYGSWS